MISANHKEINESVRELDRLLDNINDDELIKPQQSSLYCSTASLYVPGQKANRPRFREPASSLTEHVQPCNLTSHSQNELNHFEPFTKHEVEGRIEKQPPSPHEILVKDVVEEEIFVDFPKTPLKKKRTGRLKSKTSIGVSDDCRDIEHLENNKYRNGLGERSSSESSLESSSTYQTETSSVNLDTSKFINCHVCGERVVGQVITAIGKSYHLEHFTCSQCHKQIGTENFYEKDGLPYCENDYQQLFSPKCAACGEPIMKKVTMALDKTFHPEHFVCAHCGCQFDPDDGFHEKDGKAYCKNDYYELFASKCLRCHLPITSNYITALGGQWHSDCFVCSDCNCPFGEGKFFDIDGVPYCEIHYHARRGSLCFVCREPVIGRCITAMFRKFHPDHFTCTYCRKVITKEFKEEGDKPYCHDCFNKLYS